MKNTQNLRVNHTIPIDEDSDIVRFMDIQNAGGINEKYTYITKAPSLKNLVLSGGGAKGALYPGVISALEKHTTESGHSVRDEIEAVAGSSIGAITASLFACGMSSADLISMTHSLDFKSLLGSPNKPINKNGAPLLAALRSNIQQSIHKIFQSNNNVKTSAAYQALSNSDKKNIDEILYDINAYGKINSPITFAILRSLHRLDPVNFKDLSVTAVCKQTGELFIFNAENSPDLEIALACRASASLPVILEPVKIKKTLVGKDESGDYEFVDGGYLNNIPVSAVDSKQKKIDGFNEGAQSQNLHTLVIVFDEAKKSFNQSPFLNANPYDKSKIYSPGRFERFIRNNIPKWLIKLNTKEKNTEQKQKGLEEVKQDFTQRNIALAVDGIKSNDFNKAKQNASQMINNGEAQTTTYLQNHLIGAGEATSYSFDNLTSLFLFIPMEKLEKIKNNQEQEFHTKDFAQLATHVSNFRNKLDNDFEQIIHASETVKTMLTRLVAIQEKFGDANSKPYFDYIAERLFQSGLFNTILASVENIQDLDTDNTKLLFQSILNKVEKETLIHKQKEYIQWIDKNISHLSPKNKIIVEKARGEIILASSNNDLLNALRDIKNMKPGFTGSFFGSSTDKICKEAAKKIELLQAESLGITTPRAGIRT